MSFRYDKTSSRQEGSSTTSRQLKDLAKRYLAHLQQKMEAKPQEILEAWPRVIGPSFAAMTQAVRFEEGVLYVKVRNSSLLSLLHSPSERGRLVEALRTEIPDVDIKDISFRIG